MQVDQEFEALKKQFLEELRKINEEYEENKEEIEAFWQAKDGNSAPLADFFLSGGIFQTQEARDLVAARVRGDKQRSGLKRFYRDRREVLGLVCEVALIMHQENVTEYRAIETLCDRDPKRNFYTLRSRVRRNSGFRKLAYAFFEISAHESDRRVS